MSTPAAQQKKQKDKRSVRQQIADKMDAILSLKDASEKTEQLLTLKEQMYHALDQEANRVDRLAKRILLSSLAAQIVLIPLAMTGLALSPVFGFAALITFAVGVPTGFVLNSKSVTECGENTLHFESSINQHVLSLIERTPNQTLESPRLKECLLRHKFNAGASPRDHFAKIAEQEKMYRRNANFSSMMGGPV